MRPVTLNLNAVADPAIKAVLSEIAASSRLADIVTMAQNYTITGSFTPTRSLNVSTATTAQIAVFLATLITDFQKGGANRTG